MVEIKREREEPEPPPAPINFTDGPSLSGLLTAPFLAKYIFQTFSCTIFVGSLFNVMNITMGRESH